MASTFIISFRAFFGLLRRFPFLFRNSETRGYNRLEGLYIEVVGWRLTALCLPRNPRLENDSRTDAQNDFVLVVTFHMNELVVEGCPRTTSPFFL
jgi:hypothetical protein